MKNSNNLTPKKPAKKIFAKVRRIVRIVLNHFVKPRK